ncbi:hypothetical protein CW304_25330 [Bacillus sp. UFRGS-B20]|nr:hypothetical protein CW304_25330 [Bacillus sp. UFRGS-B20]
MSKNKRSSRPFHGRQDQMGHFYYLSLLLPVIDPCYDSAIMRPYYRKMLVGMQTVFLPWCKYVLKQNSEMQRGSNEVHLCSDNTEKKCCSAIRDAFDSYFNQQLILWRNGTL